MAGLYIDFLHFEALLTHHNHEENQTAARETANPTGAREKYVWHVK